MALICRYTMLVQRRSVKRIGDRWLIVQNKRAQLIAPFLIYYLITD